MTDDTQVIPPPWSLGGIAYACLLRFPPEVLDEGSFLPAQLQGQRRGANLGQIMFVDYSRSVIGPYHELFFIPGAFPFADGRTHWTISRILVSSEASLINGQRNWGMPKEQAEFEVDYSEKGVARVSVRKDGNSLVELGFRSYPLPLPVTTNVLPASWHTLAQVRDNEHYIYTPKMRGTAWMGRLLEARSNAEYFPDLSQAKPVVAAHLTNFQLYFPRATILPATTAAPSVKKK